MYRGANNIHQVNRPLTSVSYLSYSPHHSYTPTALEYFPSKHHMETTMSVY